MSSQEITDIENEIARLEDLRDKTLGGGNIHDYSHFKGRAGDMAKVLAALKDLDDRIG